MGAHRPKAGRGPRARARGRGDQEHARDRQVPRRRIRERIMTRNEFLTSAWCGVLFVGILVVVACAALIPLTIFPVVENDSPPFQAQPRAVFNPEASSVEAS